MVEQMDLDSMQVSFKIGSANTSHTAMTEILALGSATPPFGPFLVMTSFSRASCFNSFDKYGAGSSASSASIVTGMCSPRSYSESVSSAFKACFDGTESMLQDITSGLVSPVVWYLLGFRN